MAHPSRGRCGGVGTIVLLLPFIVPRLSFDHSESQRGADPTLLSDSRFLSADELSVIAQPTRSTFLFPRPSIVSDSLQRLPDPRYALEETMFPGLILLAGFTLFLFGSAQRRAAPAARCSPLV